MKILHLFVHAITFVSIAGNPFYNHVPKKPPNSPKAHYLSKLVKDARLVDDNSRIRSLEEAEVDLSGYEVKFEKCQFVKAYSDDLAADEGHNSVLDLQKFVIFRLCPAGTCSNCVYDYGEYIMDMTSYLEATVEYFQDWEENMCNQCDELCANDDDANNNNNNNERRLDVIVDCDECVNYCQKIDEMEENGFLEASKLIQCQQIFESDDGASLYAGAICSSNGEKIKIGLFTDEYCSVFQRDLDVDDFLQGFSLSHALMKNIYAEDSCVSCTELNWDIPDDDGNQNGDDQVQVTNMCQTLYEGAGKCESVYGFDNYWKDNEDYANQYNQEDLVCSFISSIQKGDYDESGEITIMGSYNVGSSNVTIGQILALVFYAVGTVVFGGYSVKLYKQVKKTKSALLESQGDGTLA